MANDQDKPSCIDCGSRIILCKGRCRKCYHRAYSKGLVGKQDHKSNYRRNKKKKK